MPRHFRFNAVETIALPNSKSSVYKLDLTLTGVTNASALDVPVCVTFMVPEGMRAQRVRLVHYGTETEILTPSVYEESGVSYARFVLDGFSTYVLAESSHTPGDIDGDGKVNITDVMQLLKYVAGVTGVTVTYADVNGDGYENITDVMQLLKYVAGVTDVKIY